MLANEVVATAPERVEARVGVPTEVVIGFKSSDGQPASQFMIDSASLPAGWSLVSPEAACETVTTDCQVRFAWQPVVSGAGAAALGFSFRDPTGALRSGSIDIATLARADYLFVADRQDDAVQRCRIDPDGQLVDCTPVLGGVSRGAGVTITGRRLHVVASGIGTDGMQVADSRVIGCDIADSGDLQDCTMIVESSSVLLAAVPIGERVWASSLFDEALLGCADRQDNASADCTAVPLGGPLPQGMVRHGDAVYFGTVLHGVYRCEASADGGLTGCRQVDSLGNTVFNLAFRHDVAWLPGFFTGALYRCGVAASGDLTDCVEYAPPGTFPHAWGITVHDNALWLSDLANGGIQRCAFAADGTLEPCGLALAVTHESGNGGLAGIALP